MQQLGQQQLGQQSGQRYRYLAFATVLFLGIGASLPSSNDKELIIRLQGEVLVLQRQIRDLQESFDKWHVKSETSLNNLGSASETSTRTLSSIEDKLQRNQGSQTNAVAGVNAHLAKISEHIANNNRQISQLGQNVDSLKQSLQEFQRKLQEQENRNIRQNTDDPEIAFSQAYLKYRERDYDSAVNLFRIYLRAFGQTEKADDALFWIAESLAAQGRLAEALAEYDSLLTTHPGGDKTAIAGLKKGLTLLQMERRQEGVEALKSVVSLHPNTQESEAAKAELVRLGEARR
ncbi:MAG: tetratricopeptide repeat protein [Acidobacteria bacterium]|nr:tetratricopeptide repeat protein [Acidobacteriota bacterium]